MPTIKRTKVEFEGRIEEREVIVELERVQPWDEASQLRIVGQPTPRVDGVARVMGQATYTSDVRLPGMLIGRILRSPHPHARVVRVDSSRAEASPAVWLMWMPAPASRNASAAASCPTIGGAFVSGVRLISANGMMASPPNVSIAPNHMKGTRRQPR